MDDQVLRPGDRDYVGALASGLEVLQAFDAEHPRMTLSEVAKTVNLSPAAARRSLITLEHLGYIGRNGKRFHLTPKILTLGSAFYGATRIEEVLQPVTDQIKPHHRDSNCQARKEGDPPLAGDDTGDTETNHDTPLR